MNGAGVVLSGRKAIVRAMGDVGRRRAVAWVDKGAPVVIEGEGPAARWFADSDELAAWVRRHLKPRRSTSRRRVPPQARRGR